MYNVIVFIIFTLSTLYLLLVLITKIEKIMLFRPTKINEAFIKNKIVDDLNNKLTNVTTFDVTTRDFEKINCIYAKSSVNNNLIIHAHGNGSNIYASDFIERFSEKGSIITFDYRGFGYSSGDPSDKGIKADIYAVWDHAVNELGYQPSNITLYGTSLGCSVVSWLGKKLVMKYGNNKDKLPKQIIMQSGFYNLKTIVTDLYSKILSLFVQSKLDNMDNIINIKNMIPILILHSPKDELININHAYSIVETSNKHGLDNIKLYEIGGSHNNPIIDQQCRDLIL